MRHGSSPRFAAGRSGIAAILVPFTLVAAVVAVASAISARPGPATTPPAATDAGAAPDRCSQPPYRQFDFWVGQWEVRTPDGKLAGTNRIEKDPGGCALVEHWSGTSGSRGTSLNFYEAASGRWNQVWADNQGEVLRLSGTLRDGTMLLQGAASGDDATSHRLGWTPLEGGRVRQLWESSTDGGRTWTTLFDGTYTRRKN